MSGNFNMDGYVEVSERIEKFYEKHPDGSLQSEYEIESIGDQTFVVVRARAYRSPDDPRPSMGIAWEPFPGKTPYTKDSEIMVGETSAWGRAIAALGFEVKRGIASANEVRNRRDADSGGGGQSPVEASGPQKGAITRRCNELAIGDDYKPLLLDWAGGTPLTKSKASKLIELLKDAKDFGDVWKKAGIPNPMPSDTPADEADLPTLEEALGEDGGPERLGLEVAE